jgi:Zn-dependent protease with chaperone function
LAYSKPKLLTVDISQGRRLMARYVAQLNLRASIGLRPALLFVGLITQIAFATTALASDGYSTWNLEKLAASPNEIVSLKVPNRETPALVETLQLRVIARTFSQMKVASELQPRLLLMSGDQPNAAAGPVGGTPTVLINLGMLKLIGYNPDEWAALLGHELAHLKLDHSSKGQGREIALDLLQVAVNSYFGNGVGTQYGTHIAATLIDSKFSRDQERQSDYLGVIWALESDFSPYGGTSLHTKLLKHSGDKSIPFLSSHPTSSERVKTLSDMADRLTR